MSLDLDLYYIRLMSPTLERFAFKSRYTANFRCPICGDSTNDKKKTRAYFYKHDKTSNMNFFCHNCGASMSVQTFIREHRPDYYEQYIMDSLGHREKRQRMDRVRNAKDEDLQIDKKFKSKSIMQDLSLGDIVDPFVESKLAYRMYDVAVQDTEIRLVQYMKNRGINPQQMRYLYYTNTFKELVDYFQLNLDAEDRIDTTNMPNTPRIVIPFYDINHNVMGFQGRSIDPGELRYVTIKLHKHFPKIFGVDKLTRIRTGRAKEIDKSRPVFVFEGPIDSLFLRNSFAMMGSDLSTPEIVSAAGGFDNLVFVYDNEPRNSQIVERMYTRAQKGESIVIWPGDAKETKGKDLNEMVLNGYLKFRPNERLLDYFEQHTYTGMKALVKMREWAKVDIWKTKRGY